MRQRAVKNKENIYEDCGSYAVLDSKAMKGKWRTLFDCPERPLHIEIGSGKGQFITQMALKYPDINFLACEGGENIKVRILQKAKELELKNLKVICEYITVPTDCFEENELDKIYLNFSDPWPKDRHYKRRLTYRGLLEQYKIISKPGSELAFKTDNDPLFEFSIEEFKAAGLEYKALTRDLWHSEYNAENVRTEYEEKFGNAGKTINYALLALDNTTGE